MNQTSRAVTWMAPLETDALRLPETPACLEIEIELTNLCNASCVACPRYDMPAAGRMDVATLDRILDGYDEVRPLHPLNQLMRSMEVPVVTLAGGGDPFVHREAIRLIRHVVSRRYAVNVITNAAGLTDARIDELVQSGVRSIS